MDKLIKFHVNGEQVVVPGATITSDDMLLDYIRRTLQLPGTKYMCREAGCGACIVNASKCPGEPQVAVNSCMVSVGSCDGWDIYTIEGVGNRYKGYHELQKRLAEHNGTQCGGCTPGWIMAMRALILSGKPLTKADIEKSLASNNCRCTGIRPILDAFKTFAVDAPAEQRIMDIEDLFVCKKKGKLCKKKSCDEDGWCLLGVDDCNGDVPKKLTLKDGKIWYKPATLQDVLNAMKEFPDDYMLVAGNTAKGAIPIDEYPHKMIDCSRLPELQVVQRDQNYIFGGCLTLTKFLEALKTGAGEDGFEYFSQLHEHVELVAHIPVRNIGTIAGNLMLKHKDHSYPSDCYTLFDAVGAELTLVDWNNAVTVVTMEKFLTIDMKGKVIKNVMFPPYNMNEYKFYSTKIMPRAQNAHAIISLAFLLKLKPDNIVEVARIAYANLSPNFLRAKATEAYLVNKPLFKNETLQGALGVLDGEAIVDEKPPEPSAKFRKYLSKTTLYKIMPRAQNAHAIISLAMLVKLKKNNTVILARIAYANLSPKFLRAKATEAYLVHKHLYKNKTLQRALAVLESEAIVDEKPPEPSAAFRRYLSKTTLYKAFLNFCPPELLGPRYASGATNLHLTRPVSSGKQTYTSDPTSYPLTQPMQKLEALIQCSGEAVYTEDLPPMHNEVFAAFVLSTSVGTIASIDATPALQLPGVIKFLTAADIPGLNSFTPSEAILYTANEEVLCSGDSKYHGQAIGIIVAETYHIAIRATKLVKVTYTNTRKPVTDIKEAVKDPTRNLPFVAFPAVLPGIDIYKTLSGTTTMYGQYHYFMETQVTIVKPTEEGLEVHSATQWTDATQVMISRALKMDENKIDVHCRRIGGGYGGKISRSVQAAVACSLVVHVTNRPCRFIQPLTTNFKTHGKRLPFHSTYDVVVNKEGVIQLLTENLYQDQGYKLNELLAALTIDVYSNCYDKNRMTYAVFNTLTDTAKNTWCRSPGTLEALFALENVMEHISYDLSLDPIAVRMANVDKTKHALIITMTEQLKLTADYDNRKTQVESFNAQNRWKKRGMRFSCATWMFPYALNFDVNMCIYQGDGTVCITHAGCEMGQGINTKAAQVAAYLLKIPVDLIQIKANNTIVAPNSLMTGGSLGTQSIIVGITQCCGIINELLKDIRGQMPEAAWAAIVKAAYVAGLDLQAHGYCSLIKDAERYDIYGVGLCEVETDLLTGQLSVRRVDLMQDVGQSVNPYIDIGQVEGAFVMGSGYMTSEKLVYGPSGELLTNRTWDYHIPNATDIPIDFRVSLMQNTHVRPKILNTKGVGEPALCLSCALHHSIEYACASGRAETGIPMTERRMPDGPWTNENICMNTLTDYKEFLLN